MSQFTKPLTVNGWSTLAALMIAAGYTGTTPLSSLQIVNDNADTLYIHLTNNGTSHPATGTDGIGIGSAEDSSEWSFDETSPDGFLDAGTTWLYSGASIDIKIAAIGGGI